MTSHTGYQVIARKYRPQTFNEVVGQRTVVRALQGEVRDGRVGHAYLFTGPRGVGKTSMARIFAKALNCEQGPTPNPCGVCVHCQGIRDDADMDVIEVDAATYTKKEETVKLLEGIDRATFKARYKVYIIDEVHIFSDHSFNVLLKRLEEPPPGVVFILATTNPEKIPDTVISRCRQYHFESMEVSQIVARLAEIADREGATFADGQRDAVLEAVALASEGGMRDAQVSLDQLISLSDGAITLEAAKQLLGIVESELLGDLFDALATRDTAKGLRVVAQLAESGRDIPRFVSTFVAFLRDVLLLKANAPVEFLRVARGSADRLQSHVAATTLPYLLNVTQQFLDLEVQVRASAAPPRFLLEFAIIKLTALDPRLLLSSYTENRTPPAPPGSAPPMKAPVGKAPTTKQSAPASPPPAPPPQALMVAERSSGSAVAAVAMEVSEDPASFRASAAELNLAPPKPAIERIETTDADRFAAFIELAASKLPLLRGELQRARFVQATRTHLRMEVDATDAALEREANRPNVFAALRESAMAAFSRAMMLRVEVATGAAAAPASAATAAPSGGTPKAAALARPSAHDELPEPEPPVDFLDDDPVAAYLRNPVASAAVLKDDTTSDGQPRGLTFEQALELYPDFRTAVDLVRRLLDSEPVSFDGRSISPVPASAR